MATVLNREEVTDLFRDRLLKALDSAAREAFANVRKAQRNDCGATDADLPRLFKALDAQIEALCARYEVVLVDYATTEPEV